MRKVLRDESSACCPHCIMAEGRWLGGGGVTKRKRASFFFDTIFHESLFNLACFVSNDFLGYSCQYFHFVSKTYEYKDFRVWMAETGTNSYNKKVLVGQRGRGGGPNPPARAAPLDPLLCPMHPPLPPCIPDHPVFAAVASHVRAYTNCVELYAQNFIK